VTARDPKDPKTYTRFGRVESEGEHLNARSSGGLSQRQQELLATTPWKGPHKASDALDPRFAQGDDVKAVRKLAEGLQTYLGLGPGDLTPSPNDGFRAEASDPAKGYLLHQWPEITGLEAGKPREETLEVLFKDNPKLAEKIGQDIEVITAWNNKEKNASYWHI